MLFVVLLLLAYAATSTPLVGGVGVRSAMLVMLGIVVTAILPALVTIRA
ncbi:hypothetical protein [Lentzea sp. NEAU-D7]|nr:hypothetical protein [Lentzea sp. NEAU-D7]MCX2948840.1 hypothetical protein [Lentzea sp. NEAU-D7]